MGGTFVNRLRYIDVVDDGKITGKSVAIQIKTGDSYITSDDGREFYYYSRDYASYNLYANMQVPVYVVVFPSDCSVGYWIRFDKDRTESTAGGWKIVGSKSNVIESAMFGMEIKMQATGYRDYASESNARWSAVQAIKESDIMLVEIPRSEITRLRYDTLSYYYDIITKDRKTVLAKRSSLELSIDGYNDDPRELYDIPEFRHWMRGADGIVESWFYFCNKFSRNHLFGLVTSCLVEITARRCDKASNKIMVNYDREQLSRYMMVGYDRLNQFCDARDIPDEINQEISKWIGERYVKLD